MTTHTIASGYDTYDWATSPTANYAGSAFVNTGSIGGGATNGFVYMPLPADIIGATIASATLVGHAGASFSAGTVTYWPVTSTWAASTLTFNHQPSVGSSATQAISSGVAGTQVSLNVTTMVQAAASGAAWYGVRLGYTSALGYSSFDSGKPAWSLTVVTTEAPATPRTLAPSGTVVGSGAPVLTCDYTVGPSATATMAAMQVQVSTSTSFTSPAYDSGTVASTVPVFDLAANGFTAISSGATRYWRVRVQDSDTNWSDWSSPASFTFQTQPTITILAPASGVLWDPTSHVLATTSTNISAYRVQITDGDDQTSIRFDSSRLQANPAALTTIDVPIPAEYPAGFDGSRVLVDDSTYQLHIRVWDTFTGRQSTTGSPAYVDSWTTFAFDDDLTQSPIASLVADQPDASPAVTLTWTRASAPDGWVVLRDGSVIARLDLSDVISGPSTYTWVDPHPRQWVSHTYDVRALTNVSGTMKRSPAGPTPSITPGAVGVWLFADDGRSVVLDDTDITQVAVNDRRTTYKPVNVRYDVDDFQGFEGLSGPITGVIPSALDDTVALGDATKVLLSMKDNPSKPVQLIYGPFSGRVLLRNVQVLPDPRSTPAVPLARVSFGVNQVADFDQIGASA